MCDKTYECGTQEFRRCEDCETQDTYDRLSDSTRRLLELIDGPREMKDSEVNHFLNNRESLVIDTTYGHPIFYELLADMAHIHGIKNRDYGGGDPLGNFKGVLAMGMSPVVGIIVRMGDKWSRINSLIKQGGTGQVKDESLMDTLIDLANYSLLCGVLFKLYGLGTTPIASDAL